MRAFCGRALVALGALGLLATGCASGGTQDMSPDASTNGNINANGNVNDNANNGHNDNNTNQNTYEPDGSIGGTVRFTGVTWSPGADLAETKEANRFPIPGALVAAYSSPPDELPQEMYCNECVEIPSHVPNTLSDSVDGSFELTLWPGKTYYLVVQKGEFRRVRQIQMPDAPGEEFTFEAEAPGVPRPSETTLPTSTNLAIGDNIPKIAIVDGRYEDQSIMFEALGFDYGVEFDVYDSDTAADLVGDLDNLKNYNLIIFPCGESWVDDGNTVENLREYVKQGGKLYIDDFAYDYAEQVWPEFLVFYTRADSFDGSPAAVCGDGQDTPPNECNDWVGSYDFIGIPGNESFESWIELDQVNGSGPIELVAAWDSIYEINEGVVGIDPDNGTGPNGEVYQLPTVWMYGDETPAGLDKPTTVAWPYHCGKVLYTVYHTHSASDADDYELLLQEKIMIYLIMEIQTCSQDPIVR